MKSLAWKLATLAAVIGIGFLVLLQAQRGMNQALLSKKSESQAAAPASATTPLEPAPPSKNLTDPLQRNAVADVLSQGEPSSAPETKSPPTRDNSKPDPGPPPVKIADNETASASNTASPPAGDPFSDFNDPKHSSAAGESGKPTGPPSLPNPPREENKPAGDVKQASALSQDDTSKTDSSVAKAPPANGPSLTATAASLAPTAGAPLLDLKAPTGQSEPGDSPPSQTPANQNEAPKDVAKDTAGPQLFAPRSAPDQTAASNGSQSKTGDQAPKPGSPPLTADNAKKKPILTAQSKGDSEAAPFPALDEEPGSPNSKAATPKTSPKPPQTVQSDSAPHPDPFPVDQTKEVPLAKPTDSKTTEIKPPAKPPEVTIEKRMAGPKLADLSAPPATQSGPHPSSDIHPEAGSDFQGDGTVGEQAPLGPQRPQLNIEKVAPQNALIGQPLIYSILVKNVGNSDAHDVVVEDRIPKGTKLSGTIPRAELTGKRLIWRIGNLGPTEQRKISIRVIPLEAGEIGSVATVNFVSEAAAETVVTAPRLEFELSAPKDVKLGAAVPFHFKVKNVGTGEARGVVIRDLIPEGLAHGAGNDLEYEIGRLPAGQFRELTLELKAIKTGQTVNRALVIGEGGLSVRAEAAVEITGSKLVLTRSGPPRRYLGRPAVYANTIVNESKTEVEGVVAVETVPPGMEFAGATHGGQYNEGTRTIAWRIERMLPNETCIVKSKLIPKVTGQQTGTMRVSVPNGEPAEASSQTIVEGFAALGVDVAGADGPVDVGEKVTLRVNARNKGTIAATNVLVTVDIPEQLTILSVSGPRRHTQSTNQVQFGPIPTLEGRTAATCEVVLQANKRGDSRIHVSLRADQVDKPLTREESVLVLSESSEPSASR